MRKLPKWIDAVLHPTSYRGLLTTLFVFISAAPLLEKVRIGSRLIDLLLVVAILSAVGVLAQDRKMQRVIVATGLLAVAGRLINAVWFSEPVAITVLVYASTVAFFAAALYAIAKHVFGQQKVDGDTVRGAVCVYLMIGILWAMSYVFVHALDPGAFDVGAGAPDKTELAWWYAKMQYFSFVTLTTLGYGDITPVSDAARQLAMIEAVAGQLYIAVAIASLIGMRGSSRLERSADEDG